MSVFNTSREAYRKIGINLTEEQFEQMTLLNMMMAGDTGKEVPLHCVLMFLKMLNVLPPEFVCEIGDQNSADDSENARCKEFEQQYGVLKDERRKLVFGSSVD